MPSLIIIIIIQLKGSYVWIIGGDCLRGFAEIIKVVARIFSVIVSVIAYSYVEPIVTTKNLIQ